MIQKHASTLHKDHLAQKYFLCEHCNATVKSRKSLLRHVKEQHEAERFSCLHCDYKSNQQWTIKRHMNLKHAFCGIECKKERVDQEEMDEQRMCQDEKELLEDSIEILKIYKLLKEQRHQ